jgi:hypothetical protein
MSKLLEPTLHLYILNPPLPGQIILQAPPFKYLIEHEHVKNYISLNMNVLKITNDVLCLQASFKLVLPNISFNINVLKIISH